MNSDAIVQQQQHTMRVGFHHHSSNNNMLLKQSSYRNLTAFVPSQTIEGLRVGTTKNASSLLKCNDTYLAFPSQTTSSSGALTIRNMNHFGKIENTTSLQVIQAHTAVLTDFEFYPFRNSILASSSMDNTTKLWKLVSQQQQQQQNQRDSMRMDELLFTLSHETPARRLYFHPLVDNLLITAHQNKSVVLWDMKTQQQKLTIPSHCHNDQIDCMTFSYDGSLFVTCSRDKNMRFFDPRLNSRELFVIRAHNSPKGFNAVWLGDSPYIFTCGSSHKQREFSIFDIRKMANYMVDHGSTTSANSDAVKPMVTQPIDHDSSPLYPFYAQSNNVVFLCGKGDRNIRYYEMEMLSGDITGCKPYYINEYVSSTEQQAIWPVPRHALNVRSCEIARFQRLTYESTVETLSFSVPRKNSKFYQEDLYRNEPDRHVPVTSFEEWADSFDGLTPKLLNLQPSDMISIYNIPVEEGGKLKQQDSDSDSESVPESPTDESIQQEQQFEQKVAEEIVQIEETPRARARSRAVIMKPQPPVLVQLQQQQQQQSRRRTSAITSQHKNMYASLQQSVNPSKLSTIDPLALQGSSKTVFSSYLLKRNPYGVGWKKRWFTIDHDIYYFETAESAKALGKISINDIVSISRSNKKTNAFKIKLTTGRTFLLAADSKLLCEDWLLRVKIAMNPYNQFSAKSSEKKEDDFTLSGHLKKIGTRGNWKKRYFDYSTDDHVLTYRTKKDKEALGNIHLQKVTGILKGANEKISQDKADLCFQIQTQTKTFYLQATTTSVCNLWIATLRKEVAFVRSLREEAGDDDSQKKHENFDNNLRGQLIRMGSDGTWKKRWLCYSEIYSSLYIFTSRSAEEHFFLNSGYGMNMGEVEQIVPITDIQNVSDLSQEVIEKMNIQAKDVVFYFMIDVVEQPSIILLASSALQQKSWVDALMIIKDCSNEESTALTASETTLVSTPRTHRPVVVVPRNPVLDLLRIADVNEKPSSSSSNSTSMLDLSQLKRGEQKMLILVRGRRDVRVTEVECSGTSLNHNDCFILDAGTVIYQWNGTNTNRLAKAKAFEVANTIKGSERGGKTQVYVVTDDGYQMKEDFEFHTNQFWALIGGKVDVSSNAVAPDQYKDNELVLYRISNCENIRKLVTVVTTPTNEKPSNSILNSKYVYVLDTKTELFVWIGKNSHQSQRSLGLLVAEKLLKQDTRQNFVRITKLFEKHESVMWREKFTGYETILPTSKTLALRSVNPVVPLPKKEQTVYVKQLLDTKPQEPPCIISDNIRFIAQSVKIWTVTGEDEEKEEYPVNHYGTFYSEEVFIVLFTYIEALNPEPQYIVFYWQGRDVIRKTSLLTISVSDDVDGVATQILVEQNKEPSFFLKLFKERFIVYNGSHDNVPSYPQLFEVRGDQSWQVRATEVDFSPKRLNSMHCFILRTETKQFIWEGNLAYDFEKDYARSIGIIMNRGTMRQNLVISEDSQKQEFINLLGIGTVSYMKFDASAFPDKTFARASPRLFVCRNLKVEEVYPFNQDDLDSNHAYILVSYKAQARVFVWLGKLAPNYINHFTVHTAKDFTTHLNTRPNNIHEAFVVTPGIEPAEFYCNFRAWTCNENRNRRTSTITSKRNMEQQRMIPLEEMLNNFQNVTTYPYELLLSDSLPDGIDSTRLEEYLDDEEFNTLFDMSKTEFYTKSLTKRQELKKQLYLL
jgi:hypothetical protein